LLDEILRDDTVGGGPVSVSLMSVHAARRCATTCERIM
jgi:hypothetical protein